VVAISAGSSSPEVSFSGHSLAVTATQGNLQYWAWGYNKYGQAGTASLDYTVDAPAQPQFCTRCQRCVQLGTSGSFTAQCTGILKLYFNDDTGGFGNNSGSYTATVTGLTNSVPVLANALDGVAVGTVTNGGVYTYSASGFCIRDAQNDNSDPNGNDPNTNSVACPDTTNFICPAWHCYSLVGKIQ